MKGNFGMGGKVNGGKTSGLRTAPEGHHQSRRDRQLGAIMRAEEQVKVWGPSPTDFGKGVIARVTKRLGDMRRAMEGRTRIAGGQG